MTLDDILAGIRRLFSLNRASTPAEAERARTHRHDVMVRLQQEIRALQQEIVDLSEREGIDPSAGELESESEEMASLHRRLSQKQAQLARYQARI